MLQSAATSYSWPNAMTFVRIRRVLVVFMALALLWPFARPVLAQLLIDRGVGLILQGDYGSANRFISRAMWLDPDLTTAVDISSLFMTVTAQPSQLKIARAAADRFVAAHPNDMNVRWDRMVLAMKSNDYRSALMDVKVLRALLPGNKQLPAIQQGIEAGLRR